MNILLCVSGSIACYKSFDILRAFVKDNHQVRVIVTNGALKFIQKETFEYLGATKVYGPEDDFITSKNDLKNESSVLHIGLKNWCDRVILCPASASTIAKISMGLATDLLTSVILAKGEKPLLVFPAMNSQMLDSPITKENLKKLKLLNNTFIHSTSSGTLACGEVGEGKLPNVEEISELSTTLSFFKPIKRKKILITTGATISPLDDVRYLTNPSSGITGFYLAKSYLSKGHHVTVIAGKNSTLALEYFCEMDHYKLVRVGSTLEMKKEVDQYFQESDIYISSAAISDIIFDNTNSQKMKKDQLQNQLPISIAPDILEGVLQKKRNDQFVIGFSAETDNIIEKMHQKLERKKVDLLVGNYVSNGLNHSTPMGFNQLNNEYFFMEDKDKYKTYQLSKKQLAEMICERTIN